MGEVAVIFRLDRSIQIFHIQPNMLSGFPDQETVSQLQQKRVLAKN